MGWHRADLEREVCCPGHEAHATVLRRKQVCVEDYFCTVCSGGLSKPIQFSRETVELNVQQLGHF